MVIHFHQPGVVVNPARGQLNTGGTIFTLSSFTSENLVSRDRLDRPSRVSPLILYTQAKSGACSRVPFPTFRDVSIIRVYRQPPSGQSRVHWVTQLFTYGVDRRESAGTGPVCQCTLPRGKVKSLERDNVKNVSSTAEHWEKHKGWKYTQGTC